MSITRQAVPAKVSVPRNVFLEALHEVHGALTMAQINLEEPELLDAAIAVVRNEIRVVRKAPETDTFQWYDTLDKVEEVIFDIVSGLKIAEDASMTRHEVQRSLLYVSARAVTVVADHIVKKHIHEILREEGYLEEGQELLPGSIEATGTDDIRDTASVLAVKPSAEMPSEAKAALKKKMH